MKLKLLLILIAFCAAAFPAQKAGEKAGSEAPRIVLEKQMLADDIEAKTKNILFADVRVFIRTKLAQWLWEDGADDTGRAESLAVRAVEELYERKDEFVEPRSLKANLLALLEINSKETAQRLRAKYNVGAEEDLLSVSTLLNQKVYDKLAADKIKKALAGEKDLARIAIYLQMLRRKNSPEFLPVLSEIVRLDESGANDFSIVSLARIDDEFKDSAVPNDLKIKYYKIVLSRAGDALQSNNGGEIQTAYLLVSGILPALNASAPALAADAAAIKLALSSKVTQRTKNFQELEQRIAESSNQLETLIAEADKTDNENTKYGLWDRASRLAAEEKKFRMAIDLNEKSLTESGGGKPAVGEFRLLAHDQQLTLVAGEALQRDEVDTAKYAVQKIADGSKRADALLQLANYFIRKKDSAAARAAYDEAFNLTLKAGNNQSKYSALLHLIGVASAIDRSRLSEIINIAAGEINKMPTLGIEDKPGTERFKEYVSTIMRIDAYLYLLVGNLTRTNRNEAVSLANQINRKEIRIAADLALAINLFEAEKKQISK